MELWERTLAQLRRREAARRARLLLKVPRAATASHTEGVGLVVALTKALGSLGLARALGANSGGGQDVTIATGPSGKKKVPVPPKRL